MTEWTLFWTNYLQITIVLMSIVVGFLLMIFGGFAVKALVDKLGW